VGKGKSVEEAQAMIGQTVEGIWATKAAVKLSQRCGVEMPITQQVYKVLYEGESPELALSALMHRRLKEEQYGLKGEH